MKKMMIIIGAVRYNKGSEALIKGLMEIIGSTYTTTLITSEQITDKVTISGIQKFEKKSNNAKEPISIRIVDKMVRSFHSYESKAYKKIIEKRVYSNVLELAEKQDCILFVGADNFDSEYRIHYDQLLFCELLLKHAKGKTILYDCSLSKENVTQRFVKIMSGFDHITVRDSMTYDNLKPHFRESVVKLIHDPAFMLPPIEVEKENYAKEFENSIGINISNIVLDTNPGTLKCFRDLIETILKQTKQKIVLFPHVMNGADLCGLKRLYEYYKESDRVFLFEDETLSSNEMKYLISLLDIAIVTRTHASIAAYSTFVPTMVVGYSIKSKGIANDLFGEWEEYVLDCKEIRSELLVEKFEAIYKNKDEIRRKLKKAMPQYIDNSREIKGIIESFL